MEYDRGDSGVRVDMVVGVLVLGAYAGTVASVVARAFSLILVVICSRAYGEENLLIGVVGGPR